MGDDGGNYERRRPEASALHRAMREGWPQVRGQVPQRLAEEVRRYLECGQLRCGFVHLECTECRQATLVAFSCKSRGWCPSCTTRRAVELGEKLKAELPLVAHRQWTLSLPRPLRLAVVKQPGLLKVAERALVKAVWRCQRASAKRLGARGRHLGGAVAMTQWFGSSLQLTPHLHVLVPEAVWDAQTGAVTPLPPPTDEEVEAVVRRVVRQVRAPFEDAQADAGWEDEEELAKLQAEAVQQRLGLEGDAPRPKRRRVAVAQGFSLHADTWVHGHDREGLSRLGRYGARGPLAEERLSRLEDGRYRYQTRRGTTLTMTAQQLVRRLLALVPPPNQHLTAFHGVYGPNARLRAAVMRAPEQVEPPLPAAPATATAAEAEEKAASAPSLQRRPRLDWATLQARTFGVNVLRCRCGGALQVHSVVTSSRTAEEVLRNLGLWQPRVMLPPPRGPPQLELLD